MIENKNEEDTQTDRQVDGGREGGTGGTACRKTGWRYSACNEKGAEWERGFRHREIQ